MTQIGLSRIELVLALPSLATHNSNSYSDDHPAALPFWTLVVAEQTMPDLNLHERDPTSNLPNELLAMIFEAYMPIYREEGPVLGAPLKSGEVFSHVSHRWRSIALDTPSLWTEIHYNDQPLRACTEYLSRSRKAPLNIYINVPCFDRELTSSLLDSLSKNIGRCRSLYIAAAALAFQRKVLACTSRYAAPLLESFSISDPHGGIQFSAPLFASGAPRLRIVQLVGLAFSVATQVYCLPAFKLVSHLDLSRIHILSSDSYTSFRAMLMALKSLRHLELRLALIYSPSYYDLPPIVLPALELLHVVFAKCHSDFNFINRCIHAPSLISLSLAGWNTPDEYPDGHIVDYSRLPSLQQLDALSRAYPHIERLTCHFDHAEEIEEVLEAMVGTTAEEDEGRAPDARRWPQMKTIAVRGYKSR